jgi:hypothetical protein
MADVLMTARDPGDLIALVPKPLGDHSRAGDSFGFATTYNTDIPFPVTVRTWKEAVLYAAFNNVLLWAHLRHWSVPNIYRRTATIHSLARECEPRLYTKSRRSHHKQRVYFEVTRTPFNDPRGAGSRGRTRQHKEVTPEGAQPST